MAADSSSTIRLRRAYDSPDGGRRVLVDRLWPRGVARSDLDLVEWAKQVAPSDGLRRAFHAGELPFDAFAQRYRDELRAEGDDAGRRAVHALLRRWRDSGPGDLVLVYAATDRERSHARVLAEHLRLSLIHI